MNALQEAVSGRLGHSDDDQIDKNVNPNLDSTVINAPPENYVKQSRSPVAGKNMLQEIIDPNYSQKRGLFKTPELQHDDLVRNHSKTPGSEYR